MTAKTLIRYPLEQVEDLIFQGFNYCIPDETMEIISNLAMQVGSPTYDRTPIFKKREGFVRSDVPPVSGHNSNSMSTTPAYTNTSASTSTNRRKKGGVKEIVNDEDWDAIRSFQATKIEQKTGMEAEFNTIQSYINKLTDKNYAAMRTKIIDTVEATMSKYPEADISIIGSNIFNVASSNRYYSEIYADLYADLSRTFSFMQTKFEENLEQFTALFDQIEYVDPNENYDRFCEINKINEKRKALASFYMNLMRKGVVSTEKIVSITRNLLAKIYAFLSTENKKNEVEELTETVAILYKRDIYDNVSYENIDGKTINEVVEWIAHSKVKDFKSLTNKALFKFMDLIDM